MICLLVLLILFPSLALADSYSLGINTTARQETVLNKRYRRTCMDRVQNGLSALPNCAADCATCTPTNANKQTLLEGFVNNRLDSDVAQIAQKKADQTRDFYFNNPTQQGALDTITSIGDPDL